VTPAAHIASVVAIWTMMLTGLRFAHAAGGWLRPLTVAGYKLARCRSREHGECRARFVAAIDALHLALNQAIITPWSATLLFSGCVLIGLGYAFGSAGDVAVLVARSPERWRDLDVTGDCIAAVLAVTGMSFVHAATAHRRTASFMVSGVLAFTGLGVGVLTL